MQIRKGNTATLIQFSLFVFLSLDYFSCFATTIFPDRVGLLALLESRSYDELARLILVSQHSYEAGTGDERQTLYILETLANSNPEYEELLNEWIVLQSDSFVPYLVRAYYYYGVAWSWRGHLRKTQTPPKRLDKMTDYLQLAADDLTRAIKLKPRSSASDALAIRILMMLENDDYEKQTLNEAIEIDPLSFLVRSSYLWSLKPERGGEADELMRFISETSVMAKQHKLLNQLLGYADYIFAESLAERKQYEDAAVHYEFAVDKGADHIIYREQGTNFYQLQEYKKALASFTISLDIWPQDPKTLRWRAHTLQRLNDDEAALADLDLAVTLAPMDRYILMAHALLSRKLKRYERVLYDYEKALFFNSEDADIWFARGIHYSYELINFEQAESDFRRATELDPDEPRYWYEYAAVLHYRLDCEIVEPLKSYLKLCDAGKLCRSNELKWVLHARNFLKQNNKCNT